MGLGIPTQQMAIYRETARQRRRQKEERLALRYNRAWDIAQRAAEILKETFNVERVILFGSLLSAQRFHAHSDIDLVVWGLDERLYYRAVACLLDLDETIPIDLIEGEQLSSALKAAIKKEGKCL